MTILKVRKVLPLFLSPSPNTRIKILLSNRNKGVGVRTFRQYFSTFQQTLPTEPFTLPAEPFNLSILQPFNHSANPINSANYANSQSLKSRIMAQL